MDLVGLLIFVIVLALIYWAIHRIAGAFGIPGPIVAVIDVILVVFVVLYLLQAFGIGLPSLRLS